MEEWETVKSNYDLLAKVLEDVSIKVETENFKDKKFLIIPKTNYDLIRKKLDDNIKILNESIEKNSCLKYSDKSLKDQIEFKNTLNDIYEFIDNIEILQKRLENNMSRANVLQKKPEIFMKLKQAESFYKLIIEFIYEHNCILDILKVKESLNENINLLNKALIELPFSNIGENEDGMN